MTEAKPENAPAPPWHRRAIDDVLASLDTVRTGLTGDEAARRLSRYGRNELLEPESVSLLGVLLRQFQNILVWILICAAVVAGLLGERADAAAILAIVLLNAAIGTYQEYSAEKSIAALKRLTSPRARVWRNDGLISIPSAQVVPGDILDVEAGDLIPADARIFACTMLSCVEAALTGEADSVNKTSDALPEPELPLGDRRNMLFMGTIVAAGSGRAVVVATAMQTEVGQIAGLLAHEGHETTPLQQKLDALGRVMVWVALGIVALLFGLGTLRGVAPFELFMTSVSLAVAAVPEGLPTMVTIALALGVLRMSRRRALIRRLPAVETLGSTNVICTDKTGTLTVGEMTVRALYVAGQTFEVTGEGYDPSGEIRWEGKASDARHAQPLLELASVLIACNNAHLVLDENRWTVIGDPTEGAMLTAGHKAGVNREALEKNLPKHHEIPFDSDRKRRSVIRLLPDGRLRLFVNGAPDVMLDRCSRIYCATGVRDLTKDDRHEISGHTAKMAKQALRVLGSAYRDLESASPQTLRPDEVERDLIFVGLTGMYDPPRAEVKDAIAKCHGAGVQVVMITGDHPHTAAAIASELGIAATDSRVVTGSDVDQWTDEELDQRVPGISVFARVTPAHKLRIVHSWKANDAVVAMTGDGVNDAPAIKGADIGIAMGRSGTEVARQAADMIVTDDNFASIVAAVEEGRGTYDNIRKTLQYLLAGNSGELLLMTGCVLLGFPAPLLPIHLLYINLVTDGLPALCLATDRIERDVMARPPRPRRVLMTEGGFLPLMALTGALTAGVAFCVYIYELRSESLEVARTHAFGALVFAELFRAFGVRSEARPVWRMNPFSNVWLVAVIALSAALQLWSHQSEFFATILRSSPIPWGDSALLMTVGIIPLFILEAIKLFRPKH